MPEEVHYVYIMTTTGDVPSAERFVLVSRTKSSVRVRQHGILNTIRETYGRKFFFAEEPLVEFFRRHVAARLEAKQKAVKRCEQALLDGISVYPVPIEAPVPKKGYLDG